MTPSSNDRFQQLWTDYLEGELDEAKLNDLRALLSQNPVLMQKAAELYQTHRLLGFLADEDRIGSEEFIRATLQQLPADGDSFTSQVLTRQANKPSARAPRRRLLSLALFTCASLAVLLLLTLWLQPTTTTPSSVMITRLARAQFFGELNPPVQTAVTFAKDYILTQGLAELQFPNGATAILEAPAVFRVLKDDLLTMDVGHCSVHAPPGAEGFRLETPATTIIDRGTRFSVNVDESSETEVQVIEGIADVYPLSPTSTSPKEYRVTEQQALRVLSQKMPVATTATYNPKGYRHTLPDRLISFTASTGKDGGADHLTSVTVQRDGEEIRYPLADLVRADLVWFKPSPGAIVPGHLMAPVSLPEDRHTLLSNSSLSTGIINPGGSPTPLTTDPVLKEDHDQGIHGTPGMAVRFQHPIRNGPGPDLVFFEVQPVSLPPEGDAFHVNPLRFTPALKGLTIREYDVNMLSPEALRVTRPHLHTPKNKTVTSLDDLLTLDLENRPFRMVYRVVAVGIDLSDLGYAPGERVEGLFFQDAEDDDLRVDPVFIAGLP